jgi:hypothetical protein
MEVISPTGVVPAPETSDEGWQLDVRGQTIGILWNGKPNADNLFRVIERRLTDEYGIAGTFWVDKYSEAQGPALPATEAMFEKLSSGAVAVLVGSGD